MADTDNINEMQPEMGETFTDARDMVEQPEEFYTESVNRTYEENAVMVTQSYPASTDMAPMATVYTDVTSFLRVIFSNLWLIILVGVIGTALSYFYITQQPRIYESNASVLIEPSPTSDDATRVQADILRVISANIQGTYVQVLESRVIHEKAVAALEAQYDRAQLEEAEIEVIPVANSAVIDLLVRSDNPELARDMANKVMEIGGTEGPNTYLSVYPLEILNPADLPDTPVAPAVTTSTILGAIGSLAIGVALAFLLDSYQQYRRSSRS